MLDAIDDAERAQLITPDAGRREARYAFVHELIRTTLVGGPGASENTRPQNPSSTVSIHLSVATAAGVSPGSQC